VAWTDALYARLPVPLQHAAVTAFGIAWHRKRFGGGFRRELAGFLERERLPADEWRAYQTRLLRELLATAVTRVPWYRRAWTGLGLDEQRLSRFTLEDLGRLPILEKEEVRADPGAFLVDGRSAGLTLCPTSGSSGTPVQTYWSADDFRRSLALREARSCRSAGVSYRLPRATVSGRIVVPDPDSRGPFHRFNLVERQVYLSAFHLKPASAAAYVEPLVRHRVAWATGYTHVFEQLAILMREQGIAPPPHLRAVITTSEKLTEEGRERIEAAFGCHAFQEYGQVEDAIFACEGPDRRLRVSPDSGILELVDPGGVPVAAGEPGDVLATSFIRRSQLLIRYRLGDVAVVDDRPDPAGLAMPVLREVVGRSEDLVVGPDGRRTLRFHGVFNGLAGIREAQVVQEAAARIRVKVVPAPEYGEGTAREIQARVRQRLGPAVEVTVEPVEAIPRTPAGKFQAVVRLAAD
jgi:phenylacetate-CoA ligase